MIDIKIKESKKGTIKTLNKTVVETQKFKSRLIETKEKINENIQEDEKISGTNYAINKITNSTKSSPYYIKKSNRIGKESYKKTKENLQIIKQKIKYAKKKNNAQKVAKNIVKRTDAKVGLSISIKKPNNLIKSAENTNKSMIKTAEVTGKNIKKISKTSEKISRRAMKFARETAKSIKNKIKFTISMVKAIISGTKALIWGLIAGGWIAIIIIIIICLIAMICSSIFGIFFSSENVGSSMIVDGISQPVTMNKVVNDVNKEFMNKITSIQQENPYDEYDINGSRVNWRDVIAIYTVLTSGGNDKIEVMTLDNNKVKLIKEIFWKMNEVNFTKDVETHENVTYTKLHITIKNKTIEEMTKEFNFNEKQMRQLNELLKDDYSNMWSAVIYGSSGSNDIVTVALSQVGNVGGQPYWSWYGFDSRVEWCACFVSYCANECGYIEQGIIPKFASCEVEGVAWFKTCGLWQERGYSPKAGDIIFFDWADKRDGKADHVGIVDKCENGTVYTIEGNTRGDICKQKEYAIDSSDILGYGTPMY